VYVDGSLSEQISMTHTEREFQLTLFKSCGFTGRTDKLPWVGLKEGRGHRGQDVARSRRDRKTDNRKEVEGHCGR
jgi:hypothetical protein